MNSRLLLVKFMLNVLGLGDKFNPTTTKSTKWKEWITNFGPNTCAYCSEQDGKIYHKDNLPKIVPEVHPNCNCILDFMIAIKNGTATIDDMDGVDAWLYATETLPEGYMTKKEAKNEGWESWKGNLWDVLPDIIIGGDVFDNNPIILPDAPERIWYEADINYTGGYRNDHRILYSDDGLLFVTYDHYETFYEIN